LTIVEAFRVRRDGHFAGVLPRFEGQAKNISSAPGSHLTVIGDTIVAPDFNFATEANVCFAKAEM
jgi:hypothetical protein